MAHTFVYFEMNLITSLQVTDCLTLVVTTTEAVLKD